MKYVAFISYRHSVGSRTHAERLESALKRYAKPILKPPIAIFRDERKTFASGLFEVRDTGRGRAAR